MTSPIYKDKHYDFKAGKIYLTDHIGRKLPEKGGIGLAPSKAKLKISLSGMDLLRNDSPIVRFIGPQIKCGEEGLQNRGPYRYFPQSETFDGPFPKGHYETKHYASFELKENTTGQAMKCIIIVGSQARKASKYDYENKKFIQYQDKDESNNNYGTYEFWHMPTEVRQFDKNKLPGRSSPMIRPVPSERDFGRR